MSEKIRNIRRKLRNNKLNNFRLLVGRTGRRFVRQCLTNLLSAIVRTVKFLLFNPAGWAVLALLTGIVYIGNLPIPVISAEDYVSANLAEYIPGAPSSASTNSPESSAITGFLLKS